jgi:hypothetical protein
VLPLPHECTSQVSQLCRQGAQCGSRYVAVPDQRTGTPPPNTWHGWQAALTAIELGKFILVALCGAVEHVAAGGLLLVPCRRLAHAVGGVTALLCSCEAHSSSSSSNSRPWAATIPNALTKQLDRCHVQGVSYVWRYCGGGCTELHFIKPWLLHN